MTYLLICHLQKNEKPFHFDLKRLYCVHIAQKHYIEYILIWQEGSGFGRGRGPSIGTGQLKITAAVQTSEKCGEASFVDYICPTCTWSSQQRRRRRHERGWMEKLWPAVNIDAYTCIGLLWKSVKMENNWQIHHLSSSSAVKPSHADTASQDLSTLTQTRQDSAPSHFRLRPTLRLWPRLFLLCWWTEHWKYHCKSCICGHLHRYRCPKHGSLENSITFSLN